MSAQVWGPPVNWRTRWIRARTINAAPGEFTVQVNGGVPASELDSLGFESIGAGTFYNGYQSFTGGADWDSSRGCYMTYLMYPPSTITPEMVWPADRRMYFKQYTHYCGCMDTPQSDTVYTVDAFGYWRCLGWNPQNNFNFAGYYLGVLKVHKCMAEPCGSGGGMPIPQKDYIYFTDSNYVKLDNAAIVSGQSPIYIQGNAWDSDSMYADLILVDRPPYNTRIKLNHVANPYDPTYRGKYDSAQKLGLKSMSRVVVNAVVYGDDPASIAPDTLEVWLPLTGIIGKDTVEINHDLMKIEYNITTRLKFKDDGTGKLLESSDYIDTVGYRLKTKWTANENLSENKHKNYPRIYPVDSSYVWWWRRAWYNNCEQDFNKDSLYAIGGKLTVEAAGAIKPIQDIDNRFKVTSDSITPSGGGIPKLHIVIDEDPSDSEFIAELGSDIIRAIAWTEGACTDTNGVHHVPYPRYNNYWSDTTKCPCENRTSTATGIMQMLRKTWEATFNGNHNNPTGGFDTCSWDSLAWNWKINIYNGKFIYFKDNFYYINNDPVQSKWDSLCAKCEESDSTSKHPNKEDLAAYGYTWGAPEMGKVDTLNWDTKVKNDVYVKRVRGNKHAKPWQH